MSPADLPPDIYFTPTPARVVPVMLDLAGVGPDDVVYDLGCGDGRILIAAGRRGARGVGIDLDSARIEEARRRAVAAGVTDRVNLVCDNFFHTDLRPATVLALYLLDSLNIRLRPRILAQCRPGTRVVSYSFEMGEWEADAHTPIAANGVSLWIVPADLAGRWESSDSNGELETLDLTQTFQKLCGTAVVTGRAGTVSAGRVAGQGFSLTLDGQGHEPIQVNGKISGAHLTGTITRADDGRPWTARRAPS